MGEVYRARDTKLGRDVAIKILPRLFTSDPERLARFEREARVLASLNHPHIGAIYGLEDADGVRALVLEEMKTVASLGAFVEFAGQLQRAFTPEQQQALDAKNDRIADLIKQVGARHAIMETELGQVGYEYHPDGFAAFVRNMRVRSISAEDTDVMTKDNPATYLNIPLMPRASSPQ